MVYWILSSIGVGCALYPLKILPICDWTQLANVTLPFVIHLTSDFHLICYLYSVQWKFSDETFSIFRWNLILVLRSCKIWFSKKKIVCKILTLEPILHYLQLASQHSHTSEFILSKMWPNLIRLFSLFLAMGNFLLLCSNFKC